MHAHCEASVTCRDQPHGAGIVNLEMLDDRAGLDDRTAPVHEYREALQRPQGLQFGACGGVLEASILEGCGVLVKGDQYFLAVGREWVGVQLHGT